MRNGCSARGGARWRWPLVFGYCSALAGCGGGLSVAPTTNADQSLLTSTLVAREAVCNQAPAVPEVPSSRVVNVLNHGARPDDDVDDTAALQRAIDSADPGDWIVFPPGRYVYRNSLRVKRPQITLWGPGATLHATNQADEAVLLLADEARMYGFTLTAETSRRLTNPESARIVAIGDAYAGGFIRGVVIQNNQILPGTEATGHPTSSSGASAGILLKDVRDFSVAGNVVRRSLADGIHITGSSRNGRVVNNRVSQTGDDMIAVVSYIDSDWALRSQASGGWLKSTQDASLVQDIWVSDNEVSDPYWGRGLTVVGGRRISFVNNKVSKSTYAAGILVSRDAGYSTHGVEDVLVKGNQISDVQTTAPGYLPVGAGFAQLYADLAAVPNTGQAGVEIHNVTDASSVQYEWQRQAVGIKNIVIVDNEIRRSLRNGVRIGADSPVNSIREVILKDNRVFGAQVSAYQNVLKNGGEVSLACSGNQAQDVSTTPNGCSSAAPVIGPTAGAVLACARFPAP